MAEAAKTPRRSSGSSGGRMKKFFGKAARTTQIAAFAALGGYAVWAFLQKDEHKRTGRRCRRAAYDVAINDGFEATDAVNRAYEYCGAYGGGIEPDGPLKDR